MTEFLQNCLTGLSIGSSYALIAIGYTMVYGILRLINFAHGDIFMISTYFVFVAIAMLAGIALVIYARVCKAIDAKKER